MDSSHSIESSDRSEKEIELRVSNGDKAYNRPEFHARTKL